MPSPAQGYHRHGYQPEPAIRRNEPTMSTSSSLADAIRSIPDYPKPGIMFRDITTLLGDARAFRRTVDELVQPYAGLKVDKVAGIEARGFILGGAVAHQLSAGFVPIRKKGKLPHTVGLHRLFARIRARRDGDARGRGGAGRARDPGRRPHRHRRNGSAAVQLLRRMGADVVAAVFVIDLPDARRSGQAARPRRAGAHADLVRGTLSPQADPPLDPGSERRPVDA